MDNVVVAGIGTDVGKTTASAMLTTHFDADYWKPIQCGEKKDTEVIEELLDLSRHTIHPPAYSLKAPLSPHHAARLENCTIAPQKITPPRTSRPLIIEMAGGIFVPLNDNCLTIDLFQSWKAKWVLVSKHYLGSINHTLLTLEALQRRGIDLLGIIFNGKPNPDSEKAILSFSHVPFFGRLTYANNLASFHTNENCKTPYSHH